MKIRRFIGKRRRREERRLQDLMCGTHTPAEMQEQVRDRIEDLRRLDPTSLPHWERLTALSWQKV